MGDSAYSFSLTTFSRTGKLLQIEYALNAVANGRTSLGICAKDGVVIATDKKLTSELVDVADVHKVELLTPSCGVCYSGVGPDFRVLGKRGRVRTRVIDQKMMQSFTFIFKFSGFDCSLNNAIRLDSPSTLIF